MTQLPLFGEEPPPPRFSRPPAARRDPASDYAAWLEHSDGGCPECAAAREDIAAGDDRDIAVPCSVGIRLLPLATLERAAGHQGIDRALADVMERRIVHEARRREETL